MIWQSILILTDYTTTKYDEIICIYIYTLARTYMCVCVYIYVCMYSKLDSTQLVYTAEYKRRVVKLLNYQMICITIRYFFYTYKTVIVYDTIQLHGYIVVLTNTVVMHNFHLDLWLPIMCVHKELSMSNPKIYLSHFQCLRILFSTSLYHILFTWMKRVCSYS